MSVVLLWFYLMENIMLLIHPASLSLMMSICTACPFVFHFPPNVSSCCHSRSVFRQLKKYYLRMRCHTIMHISVPLPVSFLIIDIISVNTTIAQVTLEWFACAKQLEIVHVVLLMLNWKLSRLAASFQLLQFSCLFRHLAP